MVLSKILSFIYYGVSIYLVYLCFYAASWLEIYETPHFEKVDTMEEISPFDIPDYEEEHYGDYPSYRVIEKYDLYIKSSGFLKTEKRKVNHEIKYYGYLDNVITPL